MDAKALVVAYYAALTDNQLGRLDALLADEFEEHERVPGLPPTRQGLERKYALLRTGFSDLRFRVEDLIAVGDRVAVRVAVGGTHDGAFMRAPASSRTFGVESVGFVRIAGGRVAEHWGVFDQIAMLAQLGALGQPGAPGPAAAPPPAR